MSLDYLSKFVRFRNIYYIICFRYEGGNRFIWLDIKLRYVGG